MLISLATIFFLLNLTLLLTGYIGSFYRDLFRGIGLIIVAIWAHKQAQWTKKQYEANQAKRETK